MMEEIIKKCLPTYRVVDKLGEGVYGCVFRIEDRFKQRAVKVVPIMAERSVSHRTPEDLDSKISRDFHSVREYYETIKGRGVIDVYDFHLVDKKVSHHDAKAYLVILMELYPENLQDYVVDGFPLGCDRACELTEELAVILDRLSKPGKSAFLVTDLKPSNLFLSRDGRLLIGDLGGLKRIRSVSTFTGSQFSPSWCAPEIVLRGERPDIPAAIYSYGLVSYFVWEGRLPYEDEDFSQRPRLIHEKGISFTHSQVPEKIRHLVQRCLSFESAQRPGDFGEIVACFRGKIDRSPSVAFYPATVTDPGTRTLPYEGSGTQTVRRTGIAARTGKPEPGATWVDPLLGMTFIKVPGGRFKMGCLDGDHLAEDNERPSHHVDIDSFWLGKFPVTQLQWKTVMGNNPSHFLKGEKYPVEQISWNDAITFVKKLSGLHGGKYTFWLPAEAQWEFSARSGGKPEIFSGGGNVDRVAWYRDNSDFSPHPVGEKMSNGIGLYDMSGNVMEWCADVYVEDAYRLHGGAAKTGSSGSRLNRACRGGSWTHGARRCRTTARRGIPAGLRYTSLGFRVVRLN